ncbi:hypothetical protein WJX72_008827 [[Myrmecia] bisecta]|uniref:Uncharacterized protein n=1 Tax=[Myrmecia] bisecta TaxID=41462 RepID=A0AAW1PSC5_9CHLO
MESVLERNWRRVASTHKLQDLAAADDCTAADDFNWKILCYGVLLIFIAACSLTGLVLCMMAPYLLSLTPSNRLLLFLRDDEYYHLLVPLTIPVSIIAVFLNWMSLKFFKHNS